eukprot:jgi/Tetstr1/438191/TSEL_026791.t1
MTVGPRAARLALVLLLAAAAVHEVAASHFRYGAISWSPGALTRSGEYQAVFELKLAYRKDYYWGAYFKEQWRKSPAAGVEWRKTVSGLPGPGFDCDAPGSFDGQIQCFTQSSGIDYAKGYQIKFPVSMGANGLDLVPNLDGRSVYLPNGEADPLADAENLGGRMCSSPDNKGVLGNADAEDITHDSDENFPQYSIGNLLPRSSNDPNLIRTCTPWAQANGFFFGDTVYSYFTEGVVLNIEAVDHEFSMLGNAIRGTSDPIRHIYPAPSNAGKPYIAYFTGGNRLSTLNNNADGRFRLEVGVSFNMEFGADGRRLYLKNRSPVASTMPIMPVLYQDGGFQFQIAAIDPDMGDPDLADQVRFFLGNRNEMGGVLGNPVYVPLPDNSTQQVFTWYEDNFHSFICQQRLAISSTRTFNPLDDVCTSQIYVGRDQAIIYASAINGYTPRPDVATADLLRAWDDSKNLPHLPPDLTLDPLSGFVTWKTGRDPWTPDSDGTLQKDPGLWQLTVMVEERHGNEIDPVTGFDILADGTTQYPTKGFGTKVPLDFLMYLYTPMHYCSKGCNNAVAAGSTYPSVLQTFESSNGLYGDAMAATSVRSDGLQGPGTGQCRLCGGGGSLEPFYNLGYKVKYYEEAKRNAPMFCRVPTSVAYVTVETDLLRNGSTGATGTTFGLQGVNLDDSGLNYQWKRMPGGSLPGWRYNPTADSGLAPNFCESARTYTGPTTQVPGLAWDGWVFQGCLGYRDNVTLSILPYDGELDSCLLNTRPEFITLCTLEHPSGDCASLNSTASPLRTTPAMGCDYRMQSGVGLIPQDASMACCAAQFPLAAVTGASMNATQGLYPGMYAPAVITGIKGQPVIFDLVATDFDQCVELEIQDTGLYTGMTLSPHERIDPRTVARTFTWDPVGSDGKLVFTSEVDARDEVSLVCFYAYDRYLATANPFHCVRIELAVPASIRWCDQPSGTVSPAAITTDGAVLPAWLGEETCVDLCVAKRDEETALVATSYNLAINFPPSGGFRNATGDDPLLQQWCFTPTPAEECVYTVCFQGYDEDTVDTTDYFESALETTNVRCVKIEVHNTVAEFSGAEIMEADELGALVVPDAEAAITGGEDGGFTMSAWVFPSCTYANVNQTIMYFGSTRPSPGNPGGAVELVRAALNWHHIPGGDGLGYFSYEDAPETYVRRVTTSAPGFCCNCWHWVGVSVGKASGKGTLYVDGTRPGHGRRHSRDALFHDAVDFVAASSPDTNADGGVHGKFSVGGRRGVAAGGFQGQMDEVRVWARAMSNTQVLETIYARVPDAADPTLVAHFHMRNAPPTLGGLPTLTPVLPLADGSGRLPNGLASLSGPVPTFPLVPIPVMVPCVLGIQHSVGPVDGECLTDVFGWSFADSTNVVCEFGGQDSPGRFVSSQRVRCVTPGHVSPRFAEVKVSNDGYRFTDTVGAAKTVHHLFMESSLYTDGGGEGGVAADGVCLDLPTREMTFGGWFCPKCTMPGQPVPPPPAPPPPPPTPEEPTPTPTPTIVPGG